MRQIRKQNGFAVLEATVVMPTIVTAVALGIALLYLFFAKLWLERTVYEGAICLSSTATRTTCESKLRRDVHNALPFGRLESLRMNRTSQRATTELRWVLGLPVTARRLTRLEFKSEIALPLVDGS